MIRKKIVALKIKPDRLEGIRRQRLDNLGVNSSDYSSPQYIYNEIMEADQFFRKNRRWPVIDVSDRSIEETASLVRDKLFGKDRRIS